MYKAVVTNKGRKVKTVKVAAPADADLDDVFAAALSAAGETRVRLFGWSLTFWESTGDWMVDLDTD